MVIKKTLCGLYLHGSLCMRGMSGITGNLAKMHYFWKKTNTCCLLASCAILVGVCLQDSAPDFSVEILRRNRLELVIVQDEWTLYLSKQLQCSIRLSPTSVERRLMKYYTKSIQVLQRTKQVAKEREVNASCNCRVFLSVFCTSEKQKWTRGATWCFLLSKSDSPQ